MPKVKLNARFVEAIRPPAEGRVEYWDSTVLGLCLRVSTAGGKIWTIKYRAGGGRTGRQRRLKLGRFPGMMLADARGAAKDYLAAIDRGADPAAERDARRAGEDVAAFAARWCDELRRNGRKTVERYEAILARDILPVIGRSKPAEVRRAQVREILDRVMARGATTQANRTFEVVRALFRWVARNYDDVLEADPSFGLRKPFEEKPRDRLLSDDELRALWRALDATREVEGRSRGGRPFVARKRLVSEPVAIALKLLMLTGQRSGEVGRAHLAEVDLAAGVWTLPAERTKAGRRQVVPLSAEALALIERAAELAEDSAWLFPAAFTTKRRPGGPISETAANHALARAAAAVGVEDVKVHDLRRAVASGLARLGFGDDVIGAVWNHAPKGITGRHYNLHRYEFEKRRALQAWADHLASLVSESVQGAQIISFGETASS